MVVDKVQLCFGTFSKVSILFLFFVQRLLQLR